MLTLAQQIYGLIGVLIIIAGAIAGIYYAIRNKQRESSDRLIDDQKKWIEAQKRNIDDLLRQIKECEGLRDGLQEIVDDLMQFKLRFYAREALWDRNERKYQRRINFFERKAGEEETDWSDKDDEENPIARR